MGFQVLGQMITTSISVVAPGLYMLLMVENPDGSKAYRYRFIMEDSKLEKINNSATVGVVGYTVFIMSLPFLNAFFSSVFGSSLQQVVTGVSPVLQVTVLLLLTVINVTMAYLGLQK
ncbi:MAG: hypothetical protein ABEJ36_00485 [Candidatus Nanosalina sp.]